jgi:hypothetical protein
MRKQLFILIILLPYFSCSPFDKVSQVVKKENRKKAKTPTLFVAYQKDTIGGIFIFHEENFFSYSVYTRRQQFKYKYYAGEYHDRNDTIFLSFYKSHKPQEMVEYLLKDTNKKNLIYPSKDNSRNITLEIKNKNVP